jgi:hypothetical protein
VTLTYEFSSCVVQVVSVGLHLRINGEFQTLLQNQVSFLFLK